LLSLTIRDQQLPEQVSVECHEERQALWFDDHDMADLLELTTVRPPVVAQGDGTARLLLDLLAAGDHPAATSPLEPLVLPTTLIMRHSTAPPRGTT
jgi:LacI family transcriptional regulator, repressor for deo operon, udp, cdd, tsx, nupC, and nupG